MNVWKRIEKAMSKPVGASLKLPDVNSTPGRSNPQPQGNQVYVSNAQSWNPETHPEGRGDSYLVQDIDYKDGILDVTYRDGFTAEYQNISPEEAKEFASSDSKGRWAHRHLFNKPYTAV